MSWTQPGAPCECLYASKERENVAEERNTDRREFLRALARGLGLGALALGTGWLVGRSEQRCVSGQVCRGCSTWTKCALPERDPHAGRSLSATPPGQNRPFGPGGKRRDTEGGG